MLKAFTDRVKERTIGIVDDSRSLRDALAFYYSDVRGFTVVCYSSFHSVKDWNSCSLWILDNDTGERMKGQEVARRVPNSIVYTGDNNIDDDIRAQGRYIDKMDTEGLEEFIMRFFDGK